MSIIFCTRPYKLLEVVLVRNVVLGRLKEEMKKLLLILSVLLFTTGLCFNAHGANIEGHMQYKIVSYSFGGDGSDSSNESYTFGPLLITGATSDILIDSTTLPEFGSADPKAATDFFAVSADFNATPDLSLHGAFGITKNRWNAALDPDYDTSWEANLGVIYRLFNNIRYEIHFGYMETGDLFKESNTYTDVESIIMISNKLTMSF